MPDLATCPDCLREIFDPRDRRHLYPFTNCTNCGPRFSIVESLPYDRPNTSMKQFAMCPDCAREYLDPADRRFHAQPIACPKCGPNLELWDAAGAILASRHDALLAAAGILRDGKILALKGIGGFQLLVDARNDPAVRRLRQRKQREEKPFALMFPSLDAVRAACLVSDAEARLLASPESPIVLLQCFASPAPSLAPGNPNLGVLLPYSPLHHLLMAELNFPVVATSGNLSDEPLCIDSLEALQRLRGIADLFLTHNRPIVRHMDDSVARVLLERPQILRRARGYAPLPVSLKPGSPATPLDPAFPVLAVGGHFKSAIALAVGPQVFLSQHIGDLETLQSYDAFLRVLQDFQRLYQADPITIASDDHPDYLSTQWAENFVAREPGRRAVSVQHHIAHVLACAADNELAPPLLGVSWDGTGHGLDGTVWGGEFFVLTESECRRAAHFRRFRLPGGAQAVKEPRRALLGVLYEMSGGGVPAAPESPLMNSFSADELTALTAMLRSGVRSPLTSSVGRLFDAVAALLGIRQTVRFEGQAAMELEFAIAGLQTGESYAFELLRPETPNTPSPPLANGGEGRGEEGRSCCRPLPMNLPSSREPPLPNPLLHKCVEEREKELRDSSSWTQFSSIFAGWDFSSVLPPPLIVDWSPILNGIFADLRAGLPVGLISAKFHNTLAEVIVAVARQAGQTQVVLSGGCFQNRYLTERAAARLVREGFRPYWHQRIPPNDGGIALGQIIATLMDLK
jgi:hydrogenase maturation protein HypF